MHLTAATFDSPHLTSTVSVYRCHQRCGFASHLQIGMVACICYRCDGMTSAQFVFVPEYNTWCDISDRHSGGAEGSVLMGCDIVSFGQKLPTFQEHTIARNVGN
jgi:hypothetical protein